MQSAPGSRGRSGVWAFTTTFWLACALLSCGAADSTRAVRADAAPEAAVDSTINACPNIAFSMVLPQRIRSGEIAVVTAFATDPDSEDGTLQYVWSATSGDFAAPADSLTEYRCAEAGPQVLRVTTSDPDGCENNVDLDVTCDAP